jgi:hypothetical protein
MEALVGLGVYQLQEQVEVEVALLALMVRVVRVVQTRQPLEQQAVVVAGAMAVQPVLQPTMALVLAVLVLAMVVLAV